MQLNALCVSLVIGEWYLEWVASELFISFCAKTEFVGIAWCWLAGEDAVLWINLWDAGILLLLVFSQLEMKQLEGLIRIEADKGFSAGST